MKLVQINTVASPQVPLLPVKRFPGCSRIKLTRLWIVLFLILNSLDSSKTQGCQFHVWLGKAGSTETVNGARGTKQTESEGERRVMETSSPSSLRSSQEGVMEKEGDKFFRSYMD